MGAHQWIVPATVLRIVDGDTVELLLDLGWHISYTARCRISVINARELNTAQGQADKAYAASILPVGAEVIFHSRALDKYGRPLGALTLPDGRDFGTLMLTSGHAVPWVG